MGGPNRTSIAETMSVSLSDTRLEAYFDSVIMMQLQNGVLALPSVHDAGVVMGAPANKASVGAECLVALRGGNGCQRRSDHRDQNRRQSERASIGINS